MLKSARLWGLLAAAAGLLCGCQQAPQNADMEPPPEAVGAPAGEAATHSASEPAQGLISGHGIGHGEEVNIDDQLVKGKWTIIDFSSEFCPPCRAMAPRLAKLAESRDDVVVVTIDINRPDHQGIDWQSPVARQYSLSSIPHFRLYDADGKLDSEGDAARGRIEQWLKDAGA